MLSHCLLRRPPSSGPKWPMSTFANPPSCKSHVTLRAPNSNTHWWSELSNWDGEVQRVEIIDEDLGKSGADAFRRGGFQYLLAEISLAQAGLVLSYDASRLARNNRDWYQLRAASAPSSVH